MTFSDLGLDRPILEALITQAHDTPTPIQTKAIPPILTGRDVVGIAQTGTGKTAAFMLPLLQRLSRAGGAAPSFGARALVLSPTRELSAQIHKAALDYGSKLRLTSTCVVGGVSIRPQKQKLARGVDILVATPGRLLDLIDQKSVRLDSVETLILDEADQMLDIGFLPAIRRILSMVPRKRQTLLFSATMPAEIRNLSARHLSEPVEVSVSPVAATAERIEQSVMHVGTADKIAALTALLGAHGGKRAIVFTRTKRGADRVTRQMTANGIGAAAIHGNKSQGQRERALAAFRHGASPVLVATDIAARGIDVPGVELVVNFDLPNVPEVYIHRIGRTARAGASGLAVSLCSSEDRTYLRDIERLIKRRIDVRDGPALKVVDNLSKQNRQPQPQGEAGKPAGKCRSRRRSGRKPFGAGARLRAA